MAEELIQTTELGLYCPGGDFFIDAWKDVPRNIVTHAHSDHARRGSERYLCAREGKGILQRRMGKDAVIDTREYGESFEMNGVKVSLHPAGHVLGSAQVRMEFGGQVCVVAGDYKRQKDSTCANFELVRCNTFVTESTFGLPIFRWLEPEVVFASINAWWKDNVAIGRTSVVFAYTLGKTQRVLSGLDPSIGPILAHGAALPMIEGYREAGIELPPVMHASTENAKLHKGKALVIAPGSVAGSTWMRKFAPFSIGVTSGWMQVRGFRRRNGADRGFVLSDHVDFSDMLQTVDETGAEKIFVTHGYTAAVVRLLREKGKDAHELKTYFPAAEEDAGGVEVPSEGAA